MHQVIATQLKLGEQDITAIQLNPVPKAVVTDFSPLGVGLCIIRTLSQTATPSLRPHYRESTLL